MAKRKTPEPEADTDDAADDATELAATAGYAALRYRQAAAAHVANELTVQSGANGIGVLEHTLDALTKAGADLTAALDALQAVATAPS